MVEADIIPQLCNTLNLGDRLYNLVGRCHNVCLWRIGWYDVMDEYDVGRVWHRGVICCMGEMNVIVVEAGFVRYLLF